MSVPIPLPGTRHAPRVHSSLVHEPHCAHHAHGREGFRHIVSLQARLVAHILGRAQPFGPAEPEWTLTCDADTDQVHCGNELLWKTGGKAVYQYVLDTVSEADLLWYDLVTTFVWAHHELRHVRAGRALLPEYRPTYWRLGHQLPAPPWQTRPVPKDLADWVAEIDRLQAEIEQLTAGRAHAAEAPDA